MSLIGKTQTPAQLKARHNNWLIVRLRGAKSLFAWLHYSFEDSVICKKAGDSISACEDIEVRLKELYEEEKEAGKDGQKREVLQ